MNKEKIQIESNYLLSNSQYLSMQETENGIDFTIYNYDGTEFDGGVMECDLEKITNIKEIFNRLSEFTGIKEISEKKIEVSEELVPSFQEKIGI